jgi:hypothetical protein
MFESRKFHLFILRIKILVTRIINLKKSHVLLAKVNEIENKVIKRSNGQFLP